MTLRSTRTATIRPDARLAAFIAAALLIGQGTAGLVFALDPTARAGVQPAEVGLPAAMFVVIFTVIYAGMGTAAWRVLREPAPLAIDRPVLLAAIATGFVHTLLFWVSRGLPAILVADVNGVLAAVAVTALIARYCRAAVIWLLPYAGWMLLTTAIKIIVIATGHPLI